jgi:hypothetical protein
MQVGNPPPRGNSIQGEEGSGVQRGWVPSETPGLPTRTPRGQPRNREETRTSPDEIEKSEPQQSKPGIETWSGNHETPESSRKNRSGYDTRPPGTVPVGNLETRCSPSGRNRTPDNFQIGPGTGPGTRTTIDPNDDMSSTADEDRNQYNAAQRPSGESRMKWQEYDSGTCPPDPLDSPPLIPQTAASEMGTTTRRVQMGF